MNRGVSIFDSRNMMPLFSSLALNILNNTNLFLNYFGYVLEPIDDIMDLNKSRSEKKKINPSEDLSFNDECENFSDDSFLSYVKSSTFTSTSTGESKKFITPTESFERTLENDDFHDEELSFDAGEGDAVFVSSVAVSLRQYPKVNGTNDVDDRIDNEEEKFQDTLSHSDSSESVEVGMEIAEDQAANNSQNRDNNENVAKKDVSKGITEHNEEDIVYVKTVTNNPSSTKNVNMSKGNSSTRGKVRRKGKKK